MLPPTIRNSLDAKKVLPDGQTAQIRQSTWRAEQGEECRTSASLRNKKLVRFSMALIPSVFLDWALIVCCCCCCRKPEFIVRLQKNFFQPKQANLKKWINWFRISRQHSIKFISSKSAKKCRKMNSTFLAFQQNVDPRRCRRRRRRRHCRLTWHSKKSK